MKLKKKPEKLTATDYHAIGTLRSLLYNHKNAYTKFMLARFPNMRDTKYASEWAERFFYGTMFGMADSDSIKELIKAYDG